MKRPEEKIGRKFFTSWILALMVTYLHLSKPDFNAAILYIFNAPGPNQKYQHVSENVSIHPAIPIGIIIRLGTQ